MVLLAALACTPRPPLDCDDAVSPAPPSDLPEVVVERVDPGRSEVAAGFVLLNEWTRHQSYAMTIDGCGNRWWWAASSDPEEVKITRVRLARDGHSVLYAELDRDQREDRTRILRVDPATGETTETRAVEGHHDFVELKDGRLAWLAWESRQNIWFDSVWPTTAVAADRLLVAPEGGEPEQLFSFFDDAGHEPFWSCSHMNAGTYLPGHMEWTHTNSLAVDDASGAFFLAVRNWDAVVRVEPDGRVGWELGGPDGDLHPGPLTRLPRHGHATELEPDRMLFFDNGNHDPQPRESRVVEYRLDPERGHVEEVWSWPTGGYSDYLGDARTLPGGNVLIARPGGSLIEVTRDGDVVWKAEVDAKVGRVEFLERWDGSAP